MKFLLTVLFLAAAQAAPEAEADADAQLLYGAYGYGAHGYGHIGAYGYGLGLGYTGLPVVLPAAVEKAEEPAVAEVKTVEAPAVVSPQDETGKLVVPCGTHSCTMCQYFHSGTTTKE